MDDKLNTMTAGPRGPVLLQDFVYLDEMAHFDRERIPERVVHAKGAGELTGPLHREPTHARMHGHTHTNTHRVTRLIDQRSSYALADCCSVAVSPIS